jgi:glycosyltransferase involved in cell wall biosynthesis
MSALASPRWSVMIPTYNRATYLEQALRSVLAQDPGPEQMQIEVVDNSSNHDVRAVLDRLASPRVALAHVPERRSMTAAMSDSVARARGQWVHILHDDDFTHPGFYAQVAAAFTEHPEVGAVMARYQSVDAQGQPLKQSRLERPTPGVLEGWLEQLILMNHAQYVTTVVRRDVYAAVGPFNERLVACSDWDMWKRIAARYPVWYLPEVLGSYRQHAGSDTTGLVRTGINVADSRLGIELSAAYLPPAQAPGLLRLARRYQARAAYERGLRLLGLGDRTAAWAQLREGWKTYPSPGYVLRLGLGAARRRLVRPAV